MKFSISKLEVVATKDLQDVVRNVHFVVTDTMEGKKVSFSSICALSEPDPKQFCPFAELTEAQVIKWVKERVPTSVLKTHLASKLNGPFEKAVPWKST